MSITQYMAFLLWELQPYDSSNNRLNYFSVWRNIKAIYKSSVNCDLLLKTLSSLSAKPEDLHEWAVHTENEEWNFEGFQRAPFLLDGKGNYLSISDYTLSNAFFEKLYWLIRDCYSTEDIYGNFDMNTVVGSVVQNPKNPNLWGIRNESTENWTYIKPDGMQIPVAIGKSAAIAKDVRIDFGQMTGEFK